MDKKSLAYPSRPSLLCGSMLLLLGRREILLFSDKIPTTDFTINQLTMLVKGQSDLDPLEATFLTY